MTRITGLWQRLSRSERGSMAIETAIVAPVLVMLSLGSFEVSRMVARQHELQNCACEASAIALAANMGAETNTQQIAGILKDSLHLSTNEVTVTKVYRCNAQTTVTTTVPDCDDGNEVMSTYIRLQLTDSHAPIWTKFGVGTNFNYSVQRTVQLS